MKTIIFLDPAKTISSSNGTRYKHHSGRKKDKLKASIKKPVKMSKKPLSKYEGPSLIFTYYCIVRILSVVNAYSILTKQQLLVKLYKASSVKLLKN